MKLRLILTLPLAVVIFTGCNRDFNPNSVKLDNADKKASYALGRNVGIGLKTQGLNLEKQSFLAGILDGLEDRSQLSAEELREGMLKIHDQNVKNKDSQNNTELAKIAAENEKVSQAFIQEKSKSPDMKKSKSGLLYRVMNPGTGRNVQETDQVLIHYTGKIADGQIFDSTIARGQPSQLLVKDLVPGWREALTLMKTGSKMEVVIPPNLGFGEAGAGAIGPNSVLHIEMEVLKIL